jgi:plastocyanin
VKRAALILIAAWALAGCGGDDNGGSGSGGSGRVYGSTDAGGKANPATNSASTPTQAAGGGSAQPVRVSLKDLAFHPGNVAVHEGQAVRWTNDDNVAHTVVATSGASFDSGTLDPGKGAFYETTMRNAGAVAYHCTIHPNMTGTIKIVP